MSEADRIENEKLKAKNMKVFKALAELLKANEKLREAVAAERERCAKIAENIYYPNEGKLIAAAIREGEDN